MTLKFGMSGFQLDAIPLKFRTYLKSAALPVVPTPFGHVLVSAPRNGWGMLGNDSKGDCTIAGIAHGQMLWDWVTRKTLPPFTSQGIIRQYLNLTDGVDSGLDPVRVAEWWRNVGLTDATGTVHTIRNYTALTNVPELVEAAFLFGWSGLGLWLPDSAIRQFEAGHRWDDTSGTPDPGNGHFVPLVGSNSVGDLMVVTWGRLHAATPGWVRKYFAGGIAYASKDYMLATGLSPEGYDFDHLDADMAAVSAE